MSNEKIEQSKEELESIYNFLNEGNQVTDKNLPISDKDKTDLEKLQGLIYKELEALPSRKSSSLIENFLTYYAGASILILDIYGCTQNKGERLGKATLYKELDIFLANTEEEIGRMDLSVIMKYRTEDTSEGFYKVPLHILIKFLAINYYVI